MPWLLFISATTTTRMTKKEGEGEVCCTPNILMRNLWVDYHYPSGRRTHQHVKWHMTRTKKNIYILHLKKVNTLSTERQDKDIQAPQTGYYGSEAKYTGYKSLTLVTLTKQRVCFRTLGIQTQKDHPSSALLEPKMVWWPARRMPPITQTTSELFHCCRFRSILKGHQSCRSLRVNRFHLICQPK